MLDLGCATGSFQENSTDATIVGLDLYFPAERSTSHPVVQANASMLPFCDGSFAAVISNHSLEHFNDVDSVLKEIGRVLSRDGALFIAVPDSSTFTDRLYRRIAKGGGHVNAFTSESELVARVELITGLPPIATRLLYSSLSFLNRRNSPLPRPRSLTFLGGGREWTLFLYAWISRRLDRWLNTRLSVYGWALYFGRVGEPVSTEPRINVCIRCGSGSPVSLLTGKIQLHSVLRFLQVYRCPNCNAINPLLL